MQINVYHKMNWLYGLLDKNSAREGTTQEGRQCLGVFIEFERRTYNVNKKGSEFCPIDMWHITFNDITDL